MIISLDYKVIFYADYPVECKAFGNFSPSMSQGS